jgi:hypothetical protein
MLRHDGSTAGVGPLAPPTRDGRSRTTNGHRARAGKAGRREHAPTIRLHDTWPGVADLHQGAPVFRAARVRACRSARRRGPLPARRMERATHCRPHPSSTPPRWAAGGHGGGRMVTGGSWAAQAGPRRALRVRGRVLGPAWGVLVGPGGLAPPAWGARRPRPLAAAAPATPGVARQPRDGRPPWLRSTPPPANPERHHVPEDEFWDSPARLADARR